jgi:excinuclease ABC subunit C
MHLRAPAFVRFLGSNRLPAHYRHPSPQPARGRVGIRTVCRRGPLPSATPKRRSSFFSCAAVLRNSIARSHPSRLRLLRNEDVSRALLSRAAPTSATAKRRRRLSSFWPHAANPAWSTLRAQRDEASANLEFEAAAAAPRPGPADRECARPGSGTGSPARRSFVPSFFKLRPIPARSPSFSYENGRLQRTCGVFHPGNENPERTIRLDFALCAADGDRTDHRKKQGTGTRGVGTKEQGVESGENDAVEAPTANSEIQIPAAAKIPRGLLESRLEAALSALSAPTRPPSATVRQAHLALLKRWYYRPEARRSGEIFFPDAEGHWPVKAMLRGVGRVLLSSLKPPASGS